MPYFMVDFYARNKQLNIESAIIPVTDTLRKKRFQVIGLIGPCSETISDLILSDRFNFIQMIQIIAEITAKLPRYSLFAFKCKMMGFSSFSSLKIAEMYQVLV